MSNRYCTVVIVVDVVLAVITVEHIVVRHLVVVTAAILVRVVDHTSPRRRRRFQELSQPPIAFWQLDGRRRRLRVATRRGRDVNWRRPETAPGLRRRALTARGSTTAAERPGRRRATDGRRRGVRCSTVVTLGQGRAVSSEARRRCRRSVVDDRGRRRGMTTDVT